MSEVRPDYFTVELGSLRRALMRIKGNTRRILVISSIEAEGEGSVPKRWLAHDIGEDQKAMLQSRDPRARGGEDLPSFENGEVEIARLTLLDSVHGEVTSLRARRCEDGRSIALRMVDEYDTKYTLASPIISTPLTAGEVVEVFEKADPTPTDTECEYRISSFFYPSMKDPALGDHG